MTFSWSEAQVIGGRIKSARKLREMSLEALSKLSGLNKSNLSRAETGKSIPTPQALRKLEEVFKLPAGFFDQDVGKRRVVPDALADTSRYVSVVDLPGKELQLEYRAELQEKDYDLYVVKVAWRPAHFLLGDLLFVSRTEVPVTRDLVLIGSKQGISLFRCLTAVINETRRIHYQPLSGPAFIPDPEDEDHQMLGVVMESRRTRLLFHRLRVGETPVA